MSLEKKIVVDVIEVLENGCIQVRTATRIFDGGKLIAASLHRHVVNPGDDYSNQDARVKLICSVLHTPEVIAAYLAAQENSRLKA